VFRNEVVRIDEGMGKELTSGRHSSSIMRMREWGVVQLSLSWARSRGIVSSSA
jgi:hypothetical protein